MQGKESLVVTLAVVLAVLVLMVAGEDNCNYNTCSQCIGTPSCIWCSDPVWQQLSFCNVHVHHPQVIIKNLNKQSPKKIKPYSTTNFFV